MEIPGDERVRDIIVAIDEDGTFCFFGDALMAFTPNEIGSENYHVLKRTLSMFTPDSKKYFVRFKPSEIVEEF
jgi:hypothetical protein